MNVISPGWLVTHEGRPRLLTRWHFGPSQQSIDWDELAVAYPDRVITMEEWSRRQGYPGSSTL
jgi:hypothetical protein